MMNDERKILTKKDGVPVAGHDLLSWAAHCILHHALPRPYQLYLLNKK